MTVQTITMQQNILRELSRNPNDRAMQSRAMRWLNMTLDEMQGFMPDVEFLQASEMSITLTDGTATYAMPTDFIYLSQVRIDSESRILEERTREEFDRIHPDPANEDEDIPADYTLEYDRTSGRHVMRVGPTPDASYTAHGIMRRWHPALTGSQYIQYDKLQTVLEKGGVYHGSLSVYADQEYAQYRSELKQNWLESARGLQQVLMQQKPRPRQIPTVLRREDY